MSVHGQALKIEPPNELKFNGSLEVSSTTYLKLTNSSKQRIAFKIKTTAPRNYCVRPNCGFLDPAGTIEIAICLTGARYTRNELSKHKFLVQSIHGAKGSDIEQLFRTTPPEDIIETRLHCRFDEREETGNDTASNFANSSKETVIVNPKILDVEKAKLQMENLRLREEILEVRRLMSMPVDENSEKQGISGCVIVTMGALFCLVGYFLGKFIL